MIQVPRSKPLPQREHHSVFPLQRKTSIPTGISLFTKKYTNSNEENLLCTHRKDQALMELVVAPGARIYIHFRIDMFPVNREKFNIVESRHQIFESFRKPKRQEPVVFDSQDKKKMLGLPCARRMCTAVVSHPGVIQIPGLNIADFASTEMHHGESLSGPKLPYPSIQRNETIESNI